jgi:SulP family sulfate permease
VHRFVRMTRTAPPADVAILLITFALTVFTDLVVAVNIGVVLAMLNFLRRMASSVEVLRIEEPQLSRELGAAPPDGVLVYSIEGPFFFGAVASLERALLQTHTDPRAIVIRLNRVPFMDITGLQTLEEALENLQRRGVTGVLCEANPRVLRKLVRAGIVRRDEQPIRYYRDFGDALRGVGGEARS